jgi:hypothetical protein
LPERLIVYAVEATSFALGAPLSAPIAEALERLTAQILNDLATEAV